MNIVRDHRREPRVQPACEQLFWRQHLATPLLAARMRDISQSGVAFDVHQTHSAVPKVGEEIQVRFLHTTKSMRSFRVMWLARGEGGISLGAARMHAGEGGGVLRPARKTSIRTPRIAA